MMEIVPEIAALEDEINTNRRWFHQHPELSFQEVKTATRIVELLKEYGITEIFENIGRTGVVALIRGAQPGPCVGLRADMDALPVTETADVPYKSSNPGVMHACGHDGHVSGLLATAKVLFSQKHTLKGVVKLIFQPAEEGHHGAKEMIEDGCLEEGRLGPRVDSIYGIHLWSVTALGNVLCSEGPVMAASDKFTIEVGGKGGHGAMPKGTVDAIVEAAAVVSSLNTITSRNLDPFETGVVTCGTINGGFGYNIIADSVKITGTCRSFRPDVQELMKRRMHECCCGVAQTFGGNISMDYQYGYPPTVNAYPECVELVRRAAAKVVGADRSCLPQRTMGAEDFSYFLQQRPGCFFFVGGALPGEERPHHKSVFDFDERAMLVGASIYVQLIRALLGSS